MATKKEKRARALAKREAFMQRYKADGLAAQKADRERQSLIEAEMNRRVDEVDRRHREILAQEFDRLKKQVWAGNFSGLRSEDVAYFQAFCKEPHSDGTECSPTWDGYVYICFTALREETNKAMYVQIMEEGLQRAMQASRSHPLVPGDPNAK